MSKSKKRMRKSLKENYNISCCEKCKKKPVDILDKGKALCKICYATKRKKRLTGVKNIKEK